ncbi:H-NS histone family protein [Methylibium petroleiphilum]|uniref:Nucleoid protein H-NS n=1 Tax=Methylibium petroleiphilum (strain ATCC BAA-1232 / LMG 22953 / PM1) TaxID=420662 RepID=A2SNQ2_METPP|nr:H-NS histone family protein [Methylibium petroleiphilum]ABM97191.1 nucleoid protein H-NS [Methylibium petroleiphilum PM1]
MATKTYSKLMRQIAKLQQEAEAIRQREIQGVVARIREAIEHYQLTASDLGFGGPKRGRGAARSKVPVKGKAKPAVGRVRFRDANGNSWTGHGRRPKWFVDAIAAGATPESLSVK